MTYSVFLDTNVITDHLLDRNLYSSRILTLVESGQIVAYTSSACFFTLAYIIEGRLKLKSQPILQNINQFINTIPTDQHNLDYSYASKFHDMEDAFQYFTALNEDSLDFFITNNVKDYKFPVPKLPVLSAKDFITIIAKES
jgi:predicted nucleic acid-binding protein